MNTSDEWDRHIADLNEENRALRDELTSLKKEYADYASTCEELVANLADEKAYGSQQLADRITKTDELYNLRKEIASWRSGWINVIDNELRVRREP